MAHTRWVKPGILQTALQSSFAEASKAVRRLLLLKVSDNTIRKETQGVGQRRAAQEAAWRKQSLDTDYVDDREQKPRPRLNWLGRPTGNYLYYLAALLTFPVIHIVGTVVTNILNGNAWFPRVDHGADIVLTFLITFLSVFFFSGGINEEAGWRGFAQKRMQARSSPLVANISLWFLMVIWHIPNDIVQYRNGDYILVRILLYPCITILFGWIFNQTQGSILAPALFHASMNAMNPIMELFPMTPAVIVLLVSLTIVVVIAGRMWRKLPGDHPAVYQDIAPDRSAAPSVYGLA